MPGSSSRIFFWNNRSCYEICLHLNLFQIPSKPEKILDAPDLLDDFYLHPLDWSCNNHLAVSLFDALYIWNAADGTIVELFSKVISRGRMRGEHQIFNYLGK